MHLFVMTQVGTLSINSDFRNRVCLNHNLSF